MAEGFITRRGGVGSVEPTPDYIQATGGTYVSTYESGGVFYKAHVFNSSGTFSVQSLSTISSRNEVDFLVVAGGGGTGSNGGKGGGAGGLRTSNGTSGGNSSPENKITVSVQNYTITVGAGGTGGAAGFSNPGTNGQNSSALGIACIGGGTGSYVAELNNGGSSGGSGGGRHSGAAFAGTAGQGFAGGVSQSAGGGGAGSVGLGDTSFQSQRSGGNGLANTLKDNTSNFYAGGGGGSGARQGGLGGGGLAGQNSFTPGWPGLQNTGGGGGGAGFSDAAGANGGSGIVVIRYEVGGL